MQLFEITPKVSNDGPVFEVRRNKEVGSFGKVRGKLTESKLTMVARNDAAIGSLGLCAGSETVFECADAKGDILAILEFPWFSLSKGFTMVIEGKRYNGEGPWLSGPYRCFAEDGEAAFVLLEHSGTYLATVSESVRVEIVLLAAVALIQRRRLAV